MLVADRAGMRPPTANRSITKSENLYSKLFWEAQHAPMTQGSVGNYTAINTLQSTRINQDASINTSISA
eukprot:10732700-Lingulodinium_polyedra.AAC.1